MPSQAGKIPELKTRGTTYYVSWYDSDEGRTQRVSLRTKDGNTARDRYAAFLKNGVYKQEQKITVHTALDQYCKEHRDIASAERTMYSVKALKSYFKTDFLLSNIDVQTCHDYREFREVGASTVARELSTLRAAANHALKRKRITLDVMPVFELPKSLPKREVWLLKDELKTLLEAADTEMYQFIMLCYHTGSRKAAIEQLEWSQINFNKNTISLNKPGEKQTKKRRPTVPMGALKPILEGMFAESQNQWVLGDNKSKSAKFEALLKRTGLLHVEEKDGRPSGKITPHALRHSRATHLLEDGVNLYAVANLLGDNPTTVQSVYAHATLSSLEDELMKASII